MGAADTLSAFGLHCATANTGGRGTSGRQWESSCTNAPLPLAGTWSGKAARQGPWRAAFCRNSIPGGALGWQKKLHAGVVQRRVALLSAKCVASLPPRDTPLQRIRRPSFGRNYSLPFSLSDFRCQSFVAEGYLFSAKGSRYCDVGCVTLPRRLLNHACTPCFARPPGTASTDAQIERRLPSRRLQIRETGFRAVRSRGLAPTLHASPPRIARTTGMSGALLVKTASLGRSMRIDGMFRAFSDGTRLRILHLLRGGEWCVGDIVVILRIEQPSASRHLAYLRRARLVSVRKAGIWSYYSLAVATEPFHTKLLECLACCFDAIREIRDDQVRARRIRDRGDCCPTARKPAKKPNSTRQKNEEPGARR
jgi:ArsR family transcriptional regulator, arsenate/arsenite/antimonite-responsive transcriptional repressor